MDSFTPLENLFAAPRSAGRPVFLSPQLEVVDWQSWQLRVWQWRDLLQHRSGQHWALYHPCAAEFSACLFALLSLDKTVCLPGNRQPEFIRLLSSKVDGFAGDFGEAVTSLSRAASLPSATDSEPLQALRFNTTAARILVYTSGSSGEPQAIPKSLRQLSAEVRHLHQLWGSDRDPHTLVVGTVSHQHIYGLLFRVLWPLAAGWCSDSHACEYLEELALRHLPGATTMTSRLLVSSPTHLSRVPAVVEAAASRGLAAIFSSGAPLPRAASLQAKARLGTGIKEVFGSSETGGIAWREQQDATADAPWQPLPGVQIRVAAADTPDPANDDGRHCLEVRSAHLSDAGNWYRTSDRVQLDHHGHFTLLGRADRIVKVEGKRVSLDDLEARLAGHPWVSQARVLLLEPKAVAGELPARTELAAAVVLSAAGAEQLAAAGKRALNQSLKDHLLAYVERPVLPRKWRYPAELPVNSQGKLQRQALLQLFARDEPAAARPTLPQVLSRRAGATGGYQLQLHIPAQLLYFDGHFPEAPIFPGVVQIHWAEHFARELFAMSGDFAAMEVIKFQKVIVPDSEVTLDLAYDAAKHKITFAYSSPGTQHSSGRIVLGAVS